MQTLKTIMNEKTKKLKVFAESDRRIDADNIKFDVKVVFNRVQYIGTAQHIISGNSFHLDSDLETKLIEAGIEPFDIVLKLEACEYASFQQQNTNLGPDGIFEGQGEITAEGLSSSNNTMICIAKKTLIDDNKAFNIVIATPEGIENIILPASNEKQARKAFDALIEL